MEHKVVKKTEVKVEEAKSKKDRELQEAKMSSEAELRNIVKPLVNWYRENKRICRGAIIRMHTGYGYPRSCCSRHG